MRDARWARREINPASRIPHPETQLMNTVIACGGTGGHLFPVSRPDAFTATVAEWIGEL